MKTSSTTLNNRVVRKTSNLSVKKTSHSSIKQPAPTNRWSKSSVNTSNKTAKTVRRKFGKSQRTGKQHEVVKSTVTSVEKCTDTFVLMGSLSCDELYKRYHHHYCKRNQTVRRKCCASFKKHCSDSVPSVPRWPLKLSSSQYYTVISKLQCCDVLAFIISIYISIIRIKIIVETMSFCHTVYNGVAKTKNKKGCNFCQFQFPAVVLEFYNTHQCWIFKNH